MATQGRACAVITAPARGFQVLSSDYSIDTNVTAMCASNTQRYCRFDSHSITLSCRAGEPLSFSRFLPSQRHALLVRPRRDGILQFQEPVNWTLVKGLMQDLDDTLEHCLAVDSRYLSPNALLGQDVTHDDALNAR